MDKVELDLTRQRAGADYLAALERLGLAPDALFWAFDKAENRFVLVLATQMFDFKGPLAVAELLFKAYNAAATPKEIDPFVVRLHSPDHHLIRQLEGWGASDPDGVRRYGLAADQADRPAPFAEVAVDIGDIAFRTAWVYRYRLPQHKTRSELRRHWSRFARNVERRAA